MKLGFKDEPQFGWGSMLKSLWLLLGEQRGKYVVHSAALFAIFFYELVPPFIIGRIVDFFANYEAGTPLTFFYQLVALLVIGHGIVSLVRLSLKYSLGKIESQVTYNTRVRGFDRLLSRSLKWHDSENTGNKVQRIQNGAAALTELQSSLNNKIFPQVTATIGVLSAFLVLQPTFFFYCLAYLAAFVAVQARYYARTQEMNNEYNTLVEKASGTYFEGLSNIATIKTLGVRDDFKRNIDSREDLSRDYSIYMKQFSTNKWKWFQVINALALGGIVLLTGHGFIAGAISLGSIFVFFNYFHKISEAVGSATGIFDKLISYKVSIGRMMPIFAPDSEAASGSAVFPAEWDRLSITDGNFSYGSPGEDRGHSLRNIHFSIRKHEKVGIVGGSGSGKSTLAKLLLGLYPLDNGTYTIGQTNFYDIKGHEVTDHIALVLQDSEMFNLSLKENITLMRTYDEKLFTRAIAIAELGELIANLPEGLETLIGEKGYRLSGGERQRIGIARAVYKDPEILIFDEATSSLDSSMESLIWQSIEKQLHEKTVISIAHRMSTLKNVDKVVVFEGGTIVEEGGFAELSQDTNSKFYELSQSQGTDSQRPDTVS